MISPSLNYLSIIVKKIVLEAKHIWMKEHEQSINQIQQQLSSNIILTRKFEFILSLGARYHNSNISKTFDDQEKKLRDEISKLKKVNAEFIANQKKELSRVKEVK